MRLNHEYYHKRVGGALKFIIPTNKNILIIGDVDLDTVSQLNSKEALVIKEKAAVVRERAVSRIRMITTSSYEAINVRGKFDYIVLYGSLGKTKNLSGFLKNIDKNCKDSTRVLIYQHNHLWQWVLSIAEKYKLKKSEGIFNWLSVSDIETYLDSSGYEVTRFFSRTLFPLKLFGIGSIINFLGVLFPLLDFLKLDQYLIARRKFRKISRSGKKSLTICLTVRDEKDNIEPVVKSLPRLVKNQEVLFVEGHSKDGTPDEIKRVIKKYTNKNIRLIKQPGKGQGDAIKEGFSKARGDIVILYEGDGTSDPGDIQYFYDAIVENGIEFVEGSRFVYPLESESMPFLNKIGNIIFAKWFTFFLGQKVTDVLSGVKAVSKKDFKTIEKYWGKIGVKDPFGDFELLYGAARMGLKMGEVPIRYYPRMYGESKTKILGHGYFLLAMAIRGYFTFRKD